MGVEDYVQSLQGPMQAEVPLETVPDVSWAPELLQVMRDRGVAAYEESLLPLLLEDLKAGRPPS